MRGSPQRVFEPLRPVFVVLALSSLGYSFYLNFLRHGGASPRSKRFFIQSAFLATVLLLLPNVIQALS